MVDNGKLAVVKTPNAENPITSGTTPILVLPPPFFLNSECFCRFCFAIDMHNDQVTLSCRHVVLILGNTPLRSLHISYIRLLHGQFMLLRFD